MEIQNKGAVLEQIAPLFISQPRNQNQSYIHVPTRRVILTTPPNTRSSDLPKAEQIL